MDQTEIDFQKLVATLPFSGLPPEFDEATGRTIVAGVRQYVGAWAERRLQMGASAKKPPPTDTQPDMLVYDLSRVLWTYKSIPTAVPSRSRDATLELQDIGNKFRSVVDTLQNDRDVARRLVVALQDTIRPIAHCRDIEANLNKLVSELEAISGAIDRSMRGHPPAYKTKDKSNIDGRELLKSLMNLFHGGLGRWPGQANGDPDIELMNSLMGIVEIEPIKLTAYKEVLNECLGRPVRKKPYEHKRKRVAE